MSVLKKKNVSIFGVILVAVFALVFIAGCDDGKSSSGAASEKRKEINAEMKKLDKELKKSEKELKDAEKEFDKAMKDFDTSF